MKPVTIHLSMPTRDQCIRLADAIRRVDETAEILVHEAKRSMDWTVTAYTCMPMKAAGELKIELESLGAYGTFDGARVGPKGTAQN